MSVHQGEENQPMLVRIAWTFFAGLVAAISSVTFIISRCKVLQHNKVVNYKITHVEKKLLYILGKRHVKEVCATLNQAHKLQISMQLLEADNGYCYISNGAESLQTVYLTWLPSCCDAMETCRRQRSTSPCSRESRCQHRPRRSRNCCSRRPSSCARLARITNNMEPRMILDFVPALTMNDRAAAVREAARLVRRSDEAANDPLACTTPSRSSSRRAARPWMPSCCG
eukprot:2256027-Pleurochrysis_carterae.AAC.3